jgi:hypothetical protein
MHLGAAEGKAPGYAKKKTLAAQARGLIIMYFMLTYIKESAGRIWLGGATYWFNFLPAS